MLAMELVPVMTALKVLEESISKLEEEMKKLREEVQVTRVVIVEVPAFSDEDEEV